jgi:hypothetical protein
VQDVERSLVASYAEHYRLRPATIPPSMLAAAQGRTAQYLPEIRPFTPGRVTGKSPQAE